LLKVTFDAIVLPPFRSFWFANYNHHRVSRAQGMALSTGTRLGPYEIVSLLGAGGMGEVYRARDRRLDRGVAIKILLEPLAADPERIARFEREAKLLASLNHPHIAQIYGFEDDGGARALVMELVEGPTLADRIAQAPVPLAQALPIARQIVDALEAAHAQGIIHRDLKPANIKVRPDGDVKVLDFGLAKALDPPRADGSATMSPTMTAATKFGVILGTAAYMSPEHATGRTADRRSDIWGLGCVLYEMLTGRRAFEGETVSEVLANVLKSEPDWNAFPADVPTYLRTIVKRCLAKDPKVRIPEVAVVRFLLDEQNQDDVPPPVTRAGSGPPVWRWLAALATTVVLTAAASVAYMRTAHRSPPGPVTRFDTALPAEQVLFQGVAVSPDGRTIVYATTRHSYVRTISDVELRLLEGADGNSMSPFFSPDGKWVGFFSLNDAKLKKAGLSGGAPVTICELPGGLLGATWTADNQILLASDGIKRVSANGGVVETLIAATAGEVMQSPILLPDGDHIVFAVAPNAGSDWSLAHIVVQSIKSGERKTLVEGGADPRVVATGHLLYALGASVLAVPLDASRREVTGAPESVVTDVARLANGLAGLSVSENGTLAQVVAGGERYPRNRLAFVDREGRRTLVPVADGRFNLPRISPNGTRVAVTNRDEGGNAFIWIYDLAGATPMRRLTFSTVTGLLWSRDGQRIIFGSTRDGGTALYSQPADGSGAEERLTELAPSDTYWPNSVSADGNVLAFLTGRNGGDVWTIPLRGERLQRPLISVPTSHQDQASFSADGKWIAYRSNESGRYEIYVQPIPPTGAKYQVTTAGAHSPLWSPDGKQLFYVDVSGAVGRLTSVDVSAQSGFTTGNPFTLPIDAMFPETLRPYDITPDGKRFLVTVPLSESKTEQSGMLRVTMNWFEELRSRVPSK
jgi:serine/threonine-protein kinase